MARILRYVGILAILNFVMLASVRMLPPAGAASDGETEEAFAEEDADLLEEIKLFSKAISVIEEAYPGDVDQRQLLYEAVKGMLDSLDKYSEFIDPERYELLKIQMTGEYAGIGAILKLVEDYPAVESLKPGSPAEKAGLMPDDVILKINGEDTKGMILAAAAKLLRGEEDTALLLTIRRPPSGEVKEIEIVREKMEVEAIQDVRLVGRAIGYFWLQSWQENTADQVDKALENLKGQGMRALIMDLRHNDGGILPSATALAERFLPAGKNVVSVDSKIEEQRKEYITGSEHYFSDFPLVILVNEISASASEIFTAAMQDHHRATVIGVTTYGKASVQSVIPLDEQSAMKLTTARYLSPLGRDINNIGVVPDVVVENGPAGSPNADRQIVKALEILKDYM